MPCSVPSLPLAARPVGTGASAPPRRARLARGLLLALGLASCGGGGGAGAGPAAPPAPGGAQPVVLAPWPSEASAPAAFADLTAESGGAAGQLVLRFTAPAGPGGAAADAYDVRAQVEPLDAANVAAAPVAAQSAVPRSPGSPEALVLGGLEGGRTLQVALRARFGASYGPFSPGVAARVRDGGAPPAPADAVRISGPRTLDQAGTTYLLTADVSAPGTAFRVTARDVTLDLGGRTVTYGTAPGTAYGVTSEYLYGSGALTVRNGTLRQGDGLGAQSPAVLVRGGHDVRLSRLDVDVRGPDSSGLVVYDGLTGALRIDHCRVACRTQVVGDRHFPGVAAVWVGGLEGPVEIDHNLVTASPQWGLKVQGRSTTGAFLVHHNLVRGTRALVANGYALGIHKPQARVFENEVVAESRGIHLDGQDNFGHDALVQDNRIETQDQPNPEYPVHWTHGIKIESAGGAVVRRNRVRALAGPQHAEAIALDLALGERSDVLVLQNQLVARSSAPSFLAHALSWTAGTAAPPNAARLERNVLITTDRGITRGWASLHGGLLLTNAVLHDATTGHPFVFEYMDVSDQWPSPGHRAADTWTEGLPQGVEQWAQPAAYETTREGYLRVRASRADGAPLPGAAVHVTDRTGATVGDAVTGADGLAELLLVHTRVTNGPVSDLRGPFHVRVTGGGLSVSGFTPGGARVGLLAQVGQAALATDTAAPDAPSGLRVLPTSATRALAWWGGASDATGVAHYEVRLDGELVALTPVPAVWLGGLEAGRASTLSVRTVDGGGNRSPWSVAVPFTQRAEDRGP